MINDGAGTETSWDLARIHLPLGAGPQPVPLTLIVALGQRHRLCGHAEASRGSLIIGADCIYALWSATAHQAGARKV